MITILIYLTINETSFSYFEDFVTKILSWLNGNKIAQMDKIPTKLLKEAADALHYPLSKIIN